MKKYFYSLILILFVSLLISCGEKQEKNPGDNTMAKDTQKTDLPSVKQRLDSYAATHISADLSVLSAKEKELISKLVEAGKLADRIFWRQTSPDAIAVRDSLKQLSTPEAKEMLDYVMINYGPYDGIYDDMRFVGNGPAKRPEGGNFYPVDLTKQEFEKYIRENPVQKEELESQYTIVARDGAKLKGIPYHIAYPEAAMMSKILEEAAGLAENKSLSNYLKLRAKAVATDDYYESDMAWMDMKESNIDLVIGPIENYEDAMYNYKTAFEAVIMVKDKAASDELKMFESNMDNFEHKLPYDKKYIRKSAGKGNILQIMNVVYFGGDCQRGVKTIAASLPNDPRVHEVKGSKKSMYKNLMEAKFDKIVVPIAQKILDPSLLQFVDKKAFTSFVTLHEVSHTLGRGFVYGNEKLTVRAAMKEKYSAIEECKADILGMYNHKHLLDMGKINADYMKKAMVTYVAGLYRSIRFGTEEAHGKANLVQLNFLKEKGALVKQQNGTYVIDESKFMPAVAELAGMVLTIEADGNYDGAVNLLNQYGLLSEEVKSEIDAFKYIPRDLNTTYDF